MTLTAAKFYVLHKTSISSTSAPELIRWKKRDEALAGVNDLAKISETSYGEACSGKYAYVMCEESLMPMFGCANHVKAYSRVVVTRQYQLQATRLRMLSVHAGPLERAP